MISASLFSTPIEDTRIITQHNLTARIAKTLEAKTQALALAEKKEQDMAQRMAAMKQEHAQAQNAMQKKLETMTQTQQEQKRLHAEIRQVRKHLNDSKQGASQLRTQLTQLQTSRAELEQKLAAALKKIDEISVQHQAKEDKIKKLEDQVKTLREELKTTRQQAEEARAESRQTVDDIKDELKSVKAQARATEHNLKQERDKSKRNSKAADESKKQIADLTEIQTYALFNAIHATQFDAVNELLAKKADVNATHTQNGISTLAYAIYAPSASSAMIQLLLDKKADIKTQTLVTGRHTRGVIIEQHFNKDTRSLKHYYDFIKSKGLESVVPLEYMRSLDNLLTHRETTQTIQPPTLART